MLFVKVGIVLLKNVQLYSNILYHSVAQMSLCMTSHLCLLVLPVMSLMLLFSPIGWSYENLTPGCHLYREFYTYTLTAFSKNSIYLWAYFHNEIHERKSTSFLSSASLGNVILRTEESVVPLVDPDCVVKFVYCRWRYHNKFNTGVVIF